MDNKKCKLYLKVGENIDPKELLEGFDAEVEYVSQERMEELLCATQEGNEYVGNKDDDFSYEACILLDVVEKIDSVNEAIRESSAELRKMRRLFAEVFSDASTHLPKLEESARKLKTTGRIK